MTNRYSHIDLTVNSFERDLPFFEKIMPRLGFTRTFHSEKWRVFATEDELPSAAYFAITEDPKHTPNANLVGFWANSPEEVDEFAQLVQDSGGTLLDGPRQFPISPSYYSVYFTDPSGNCYEFMYRVD
jgi:predicted enzyme related to lactoylglutathione lyase